MMMALLFAIATSGQAVPPPASDDVVVTGQRLKDLRIVTRTDRRTGIRRCVFQRRSGDAQLDDYICAGMLDCAAKVQKVEDVRPCMEPVFAAVLPNMKWRGS
ncbi:hypothetical protein P0F65_17575 [Sphingomonas sp. I4]